jgi:outer membrane biosynthesis protein TonB
VSLAIDPGEHRAGLIGSLAVHVVLIAALVALGLRAAEPPPVVYAVNLLAAPAPRPAPRRAAEAAVPTATQPKAPPEKAPVKPAPKPPEPEKTPAKAQRDDPALQTKSDVTPLPGVTPSTGTDELTFTQAGIRFADQAYLNNIVTQIRRRWTNPVGSGLRLRVDVTFTIQRDGSVTDIAVARASSNFSFNTSARGAIERAARDRAFGPLPAAYDGGSLPVSFAFTPEDP